MWTVRETLNCGPFCLKLDVGVPLQHPHNDMPGDVHNHPVWCPRFAKGGDSRMAKVVELQTGLARR